MYKVFIEMPLGNHSKPHEFEEEADARKLFDSFVGQMKNWKQFEATVVMKGNGTTTTVEVGDAKR